MRQGLGRSNLIRGDPSMRRVGRGAGPEGETATVRVPDCAGNWCGQRGPALPGPPGECEPPVSLLICCPVSGTCPWGHQLCGPGWGLRAPQALQSAFTVPSATGSSSSVSMRKGVDRSVVPTATACPEAVIGSNHLPAPPSRSRFLPGSDAKGSEPSAALRLAGWLLHLPVRGYC